MTLRLIYSHVLQVAKQHGILVDPIYSLSAWEMGVQMVEAGTADRIAMLHRRISWSAGHSSALP